MSHAHHHHPHADRGRLQIALALILGDVLFNLSVPTLKPGLREPYRALTPDPRQNRDSARRLAALGPELVLFGHGPPLQDGDRFVRFVESLPH